MGLGNYASMRYSSDLRQRVVDFVRSGGSKAEAARRFKVGEASVYRWLKPGGVAYKRPGPQGPHKLDWEQLRRHAVLSSRPWLPVGPAADGGAIRSTEDLSGGKFRPIGCRLTQEQVQSVPASLHEGGTTA
jgi:hypothetical protein